MYTYLARRYYGFYIFTISTPRPSGCLRRCTALDSIRAVIPERDRVENERNLRLNRGDEGHYLRELKIDLSHRKNKEDARAGTKVAQPG